MDKPETPATTNQVPFVCEHPAHEDGKDCLDRTIGCSPYCVCCMGELAKPQPTKTDG